MPVLSQTVETGLAGKRILVTGASGGIGAACARAFAAEGAHVLVHFNQGVDCRRGRGELGTETVQANLTDEAQVDARPQAGDLDVCAAVAACGRAGGPGLGAPARALGRDAPRDHGHCARIPPRYEQRPRNLALIGSTAAARRSGHADYAAAKAARRADARLKNEVVRRCTARGQRRLLLDRVRDDALVDGKRRLQDDGAAQGPADDVHVRSSSSARRAVGPRQARWSRSPAAVRAASSTRTEQCPAALKQLTSGTAQRYTTERRSRNRGWPAMEPVGSPVRERS
jgi:hypothetical protein